MTSIDKTAESMSYIHSAVPLGMTDESDKKVIKGAWWMPWLTQAMKDVISCDKLRLEAHILTRRFPNGETHIW